MPARRPAQSAIHGHSAQAGVAGVHTVAPRSNSAWAKSDGRARAAGSPPSCAASSRSRGLAVGSSSVTANSRATTRSTLPSTGTTGRPNAIGTNGGGGVVADARQRPQAGQIARKTARRDHRLGAGVQVACAGVVAKAGPGREHRLQRRGGQRRDVRKAA